MIVGAVGLCGSGKTYGLQRLVASALRADSGWRFLIADVHWEWPGEPARGEPRTRFVIVHTVGAAARALATGERAVLVRPAIGAVGDEKRDRQWGDALAQVAIQTRAPVALVLPEAHRYLPEHKPAPPYLATILTQYRHTATGLLWDTQQVSRISKNVLKETTRLHIHAQAHAASLKRLREEYGPHAERLALEAARRMRAGQPGWHVRWVPGLRDDELRLER